jgi:glycine dehydrogenase subunit 1
MTTQHPYIPATEFEEQKMLEAIGVQAFEELVTIIPPDLRVESQLGLGSGLSEVEVSSELQHLAALNNPATAGICFHGGGVYDHYTPEVVKAIAMRSEFYTAYTPYQAEISQGTLQVMYEFQSLICELSGMEVANASMYDGASAAAEACSLAINATQMTRILLPETLNPNIREVIETYLRNRSVEFITIASRNGRVDLDSLMGESEAAAAVVVQSPNVLGLVEDWAAIRRTLISDKTLLVAYADPLVLGIQESPGALGADIYVGEGQSLGIPFSYGGPYLGLMAAKEQYKRRLPGRIAGRTVDKAGKPGFVMVLRTREQDIRREKATSNICTNQGLMALWATTYLSLLGKNGFQHIARICFNNSQYLGRSIAELPGYELPFGFEYLKEFVVRSPVPVNSVVKEAETSGFNLGTLSWQGEDFLQIAVTESRTKDEMDRLVTVLGEIVQ